MDALESGSAWYAAMMHVRRRKSGGASDEGRGVGAAAGLVGFARCPAHSDVVPTFSEPRT